MIRLTALGDSDGSIMHRGRGNEGTSHNPINRWMFIKNKNKKLTFKKLMLAYIPRVANSFDRPSDARVCPALQSRRVSSHHVTSSGDDVGDMTVDLYSLHNWTHSGHFLEDRAPQ